MSVWIFAHDNGTNWQKVLVDEYGFEIVDGGWQVDEPRGILVEVEGERELPDGCDVYFDFEQARESIATKRASILLPERGNIEWRVASLLDSMCYDCKIPYPLYGEEGWGEICDDCPVYLMQSNKENWIS